MDFEGKIALVTGGASGIGKATVLELARTKARVICADVNVAGGEALVAEAGRANLTVEFEAIDLTDSTSVRRCAAAITARHPKIDILVNAAGFSVVPSRWPARSPATGSASIVSAPARPIRRCSGHGPRSCATPSSRQSPSAVSASRKRSPMPSSFSPDQNRTTSQARY